MATWDRPAGACGPPAPRAARRASAPPASSGDAAVLRARAAGTACLLALLALLLFACGGGSPAATSTPPAVTTTPAPPPAVATATSIPTAASTARPRTAIATATDTPRPAPSPTRPAPTATPDPCPGAIPWEQALDHLGEQVTVIGPVAGATYAETSRGKPTFLNIGRPYPDPARFTVVIWIDSRASFPTPPEQAYAGATLCVSGVIDIYNGSAEMVVTSPAAIVVVG